MILFYCPHIEQGYAQLGEDEAKHCVQVLRHREGDAIWLTDGQGCHYEGRIHEADKRRCVVRIEQAHERPRPYPARIHLAVAPTKQAERIEWMLEKAVEIGLDSFTPLLCARGERQKIRLDRLERIALSAMKQSLQAHLPTVHPPCELGDFLAQPAQSDTYKCIAWCGEAAPPFIAHNYQPPQDVIVLIGPEGDFTAEEVAAAQAAGYRPVSLGPNRLRTETAALAALGALRWRAL